MANAQNHRQATLAAAAQGLMTGNERQCATGMSVFLRADTTWPGAEKK